MSDPTPSNTAQQKKRNLDSRFLFIGLIAIVLIVAGVGASAFALMQDRILTDASWRIGQELRNSVALTMPTAGTANGASHTNDSTRVTASSIVLRAIGQRAQDIEGVQDVTLYDSRQRVLWRSDGKIGLTDAQQRAFMHLIESEKEDYLTAGLMRPRSWLNLLRNEFDPVSFMVPFRFAEGGLGVALLTVDYQRWLSSLRRVTVQLMISVLIGFLMLFWLLYHNFRRGLRLIDEQEQQLNQQITRLSDLLNTNQRMQKNIRSASARAVQLNEQFLRRVGADLHDGPAQMIGFAVLRLDQVSKQEIARDLGHEFHAVKDALNESLEEIRGISSGLVLPQLDQMSLEECLRKVVVLHGAKSDAEVAQFYQNLPDDIPLPIKICAYRFVQEGLNNAHRHGQAKKCRLSAKVKDDVLHLSLKDNGMGFRKSSLAADGNHLGLTGLKDRVESLGGRFSINSELGVGTAIKMSVSLADEG